MDIFKKLVSVKERDFFVLTKILDPKNFTFASENGQMSEFWGKVKPKNIPWDVANNRYVEGLFLQKTL